MPYQIRQWDLLTSRSKCLDDDASTQYRRIIYAKINSANSLIKKRLQKRGSSLPVIRAQLICINEKKMALNQNPDDIPLHTSKIKFTKTLDKT